MFVWKPGVQLGWTPGFQLGFSSASKWSKIKGEELG